MKNKVSKIFKYVMWIVIIFFVGALIIAAINFYSIKSTYINLLQYFASNLGLNIWIIKIISAVFTIVLIVGLKWVWKVIWPSPFIKSQERFHAILGIATLLIFFYLTMWYFTKDNYFDSSGLPQKCYAATTDGYEYVDCNYKLHPIYGTVVKPVTPEIVRIIENKKISKVTRIIPDKNSRFFSPDGRPLVYYYKYPNGNLEFFSKPGSHPQLGEELLPISSKIVKQLFEYIDSGKDSMIIGNEIRKYISPSHNEISHEAKKEIPVDYIINHSFINTPQAKEIIIALLDNGDNFDQTLSQDIATLFSSKGFNTTTSFFSTNFIDDGIFNKLYNGNSDMIRELKLRKYSDFLCLGKLSISFRDSKIRNDMITADYNVDMRVISLTNGNIQKHFNKSVTGIGWTNEEAKSIARKKMLSIIEDNFNKWSEL